MQKFSRYCPWEIPESYSPTSNTSVYFDFGVSVEVWYAIAGNYNIILIPFMIFYNVAVRVFSRYYF